MKYMIFLLASVVCLYSYERMEIEMNGNTTNEGNHLTELTFIKNGVSLSVSGSTTNSIYLNGGGSSFNALFDEVAVNGGGSGQYVSFFDSNMIYINLDQDYDFDSVKVAVYNGTVRTYHDVRISLFGTGVMSVHSATSDIVAYKVFSNFGSLQLSSSVDSFLVEDSVQLNMGSVSNLNIPLTWSSSDSSIATVSDSGMIQGISHGTVTISAIAGRSSDTSSITLKVVDEIVSTHFYELNTFEEKEFYNVHGKKISSMELDSHSGIYLVKKGVKIYKRFR